MEHQLDRDGTDERARTAALFNCLQKSALLVVAS